jgi:hypothetical protein
LDSRGAMSAFSTFLEPQVGQEMAPAAACSS